MRVAVGVGVAAAVDDPRVVQHGVAIDVTGGFEVLEETGELLGIPAVDARDLRDALLIPLMMRKIMVTLRDADFAEGAVVAVVREGEGRDARGVGLKREREQVIHQAHVFAVAARNARGRSEVGIDVGPEAFGFLDADFHFANAGEILIEFLAVARVEATLHAARVLVDEIEHGAARLHAETSVFGPRAVRAGAKHTFKEQAWIRLGRHRRRGGAPREIVLIRARVTGVAVARATIGVAGEFERRETREVADLIGDRLVDRNASTNIGRALIKAHAGEKHAVAARVVATAVVAGAGVGVVEPADDLQLVTQRRERLERGTKIEIRATALGPPTRGDGAVGEIYKRRAQGCARGGRGQAFGGRRGGERPSRHERGERRQRDTSPESAQEMAAVHRGEMLLSSESSRGGRFHGVEMRAGTEGLKATASVGAGRRRC